MKKIEYILDVGSSKISLFAISVVKSNPVILACSEQLYDGFMDGEFFEPTQITDVVQKLIMDLSMKLNVKIKKVYVGVPSEFSVCVCKRKVRKYVSVQKINDKKIEELFDGIEEFENSEGYKLISASPMQYQLDSGLKTIRPEGKRSSQVVMDGSYILVKNNFIERFDKTLHNLGVEVVEYVSTILGQALLCVDSLEPLNPVAVVDIGHITTSVAIIKGEGLALLSSFSLGGGHITADIMQLLQKSFKDAELLKRKVALTIKPQKDEKYIITSGGETVSSHIQITNDIVKSRIENIAQIIDNVLDIDETFKNIPIYITGNGICNIRGAINILEEVTKRQIVEFKVPFDNSKDKYQTSRIGLAEIISRLI